LKSLAIPPAPQEPAWVIPLLSRSSFGVSIQPLGEEEACPFFGGAQIVRHFRVAILLIGLALLPSLAIGQATTKVDPAKIKAKLLQGTYIDGHLKNIDEAEKRFSFEYVYEVKKAIPAGQAKFNDVNRRWQAALARQTTSLEDLTKLQTEARAAYKAAFDIDSTPIPFELKGDKGLIVKTTIPPTDAAGNPKKLSSTDQAKLRAGLPITVKELNTQNWVRIYIDRTKKPAAPAKEGDPTIYPITGIIVIPAPTEADPFAIPGS
jgi:hypothetical protein